MLSKITIVLLAACRVGHPATPYHGTNRNRMIQLLTARREWPILSS
jgi:hypothetical protein